MLNKPFLLIAGECYYSDSGTRDWIACFESYEEALAEIKEERILRTHVIKRYEVQNRRNG